MNKKSLLSPVLYVPELQKYERTAYRLHPFSKNNISPLSSKIGGYFVNNSAIVLPKCPEHKRDLINLIQILGQDVPGWDKKAILQIFWCPCDHELTYCPYIYARFLCEPVDGMIMNETNINHNTEYFPDECCISVEGVQEFPCSFELNEEIMSKISSVHEWKKRGFELYGDGYTDYASYFYDNYLSTAPGWKLGGWSHWIQRSVTFECDNCHVIMYNLITLGGSMSDSADLCKWGKYVGRKGYNQTNISIGDCGYIYVYICNKCKAIKYDSQSC